MPSWILDRVSNLHERELFIILKVLQDLEGEPYNGLQIMEELINNNYILDPMKVAGTGEIREEVLKKRWGSYVGLVNAYGLAYFSTGNIELSKISKALLNNEIVYSEFVKIQLSKWQMPNSALQNSTIKEFTDLNIYLKPFIATLKVLCKLRELYSTKEAWIDLHDIVKHLITLKSHSDEEIINATENILKDRNEGVIRTVNKEGPLDIVFNTFMETGYIVKHSKIPASIGRQLQAVRLPYVLSEGYVKEIEEYIDNNEGQMLDPSPHSKNKENWLRSYGNWEGESFLKSQSDKLDANTLEKDFNMHVRIFDEITEEQFIFDCTEDLTGFAVHDEIFSFNEENISVTHCLEVIAVLDKKICVRVLREFNPPILAETILKQDNINGEFKKWINDLLYKDEKLTVGNPRDANDTKVTTESEHTLQDIVTDEVIKELDEVNENNTIEKQ